LISAHAGKAFLKSIQKVASIRIDLRLSTGAISLEYRQRRANQNKKIKTG
jgi:hypothetical protein